MLVVNLDDYNIIPGLDFLRKTKIVLMSYLNRVMIASEGCLCFVLCCNVTMTNVIRSGKSLILVIVIEKTLQKGGEVYLTTVVDEKINCYEKVPKEIANMLQQFEDVMSPRPPKKLPPRRATDHRIELVPEKKTIISSPLPNVTNEISKIKESNWEN
jgi:hypothetical protein